ncbi:hypothetical protein F9Z43_08875 [Pseudomonas monteilii]|uniref:Uncharacterized protein n=1 Tax=Pseudomonas monteilii TaxID=76759 RepID=A0A7X3JR38_9PSED|nr:MULTISPECIES: hypothetical protein [Pseudomonas putida group]MVF49429.1 hypothetical protein [Pseudomonas monteilii]
MDTSKMRDISREQFEAYRDKRNAELEAEGHKPGSRWHISNAHYPTWEASRAAVVVELPSKISVHNTSDNGLVRPEAEHYDEAIDDCREAIEAQGLKVAP